jgi:low affinity Fe/Cu permease
MHHWLIWGDYTAMTTHVHAGGLPENSNRSDHEMPSSVTGNVSPFDRFAGAAGKFAARAWFFAGCVLLVIVWAPSYFLFGNIDTWQLIINTATTIVTFLLVALLQNAQTRADEATQQKLNAVAGALAAFMDHAAQDDDELRGCVRELRQAVGLENRESA